MIIQLKLLYNVKRTRKDYLIKHKQNKRTLINGNNSVLVQKVYYIIVIQK